jgi:hypothetical protein
MPENELEQRIRELSDQIVYELISITPESMSEIQFEIVSTEDGGADIGLLENHPDAAHVSLSDNIYASASRYLPLIKQYIRGWRRSLLILRLDGEQWDVTMTFERH